MQKIPFKKIENGIINLWYYPVDNKNNEKTPCMIWIHGGGWHGTDPEIFGNNYSYFNSCGFTCFSVDYRLIPTTEDLECKYLNDCLEDCIDSVRYVIDNADEFNIDKEKIIIIGESAGGQLALCFATDVVMNEYPELKPSAVIAYNPVTHLASGWGDNVCNVGKGLNLEQFMKMNTAVRKYCPYSNISKTDIPLLLLTGLDDRVTHPANVYEFYLKYKKNQNKAEIVFYPKTEHAFALPEYYQFGSESREASFIKILDFLKEII